MSSFLQRLALRDSGALPVLKPRVPGLFEPAAGTHAPADEGYAIGRETAPAAPAPRDAGTEQADRMAQYRQPQSALVAQARAVAPVPTAPVPAPAAGWPAPAPVAEQVVRPLTPSAARMHALQARQDDTHSSVTPFMRQPDPGLPKSAALLRADRAQEADPQGAARRMDRRGDTDGPPSSLPAAQAPALTGIPTPSAVAAIRAARASETRPSAATVPVVQVTIGRVEVRASVGAPAPARQASRQQPTSLDDYLRNREGRR
jgi:hypothetical protein